MDDTPNAMKRWVTFAGGVLVIAVLVTRLYLSLSRSPSCCRSFSHHLNGLQQWLGRVPAVLTVVTLVFALFGLAGWGLWAQNLAEIPATASTSSKNRGRARRRQRRAVEKN